MPVFLSVDPPRTPIKPQSEHTRSNQSLTSKVQYTEGPFSFLFRNPHMSLQPATVANPQLACDSCGYSLQGLPQGSKCPECGHSTTKKHQTVRDNTMSAIAPPSYIKRVRLGVLLCMISMMGGVAGPIIISSTAGTGTMFFPFAVALFVVTGFCWAAGVWLITTPRKGMGINTPDPILDNKTLVKITRTIAFAWPLSIILATIKAMGAAGALAGPVVAAANPVFLDFMIALTGMIAWSSLIPTCVYFAEISYWASDDRLVGKLRGTAMVLCISGILSVVSQLLILTSLPIGKPARIVYVWSSIFAVCATIYFFYSMFKLSLALGWVLSHQRRSADKHARISARLQNELNQTTAGNLSCDDCGYNLKGLPFAGKCPECGTPFGDATQFPIRDPARDVPRQPQTPIHVAESTHGNIKHARTIGTPLEDGPSAPPPNPNRNLGDDDDSIPLVGEA